MDRFDDKDIDNKCMVKGCDNDRDFGSTQHLCRFCYDVITTGDTLQYYQRYMGKNWISDTAMKIFHAKEDNKELESVIKELKLEMKEAYILEDNTTLSLDDLRTFYHENKNLKSQNLPLIHENQALKKRVEFLEKETSALVYNMDHAYTLGDGGFLSLDDLCTFYEDNKKIHNVAERHRHHITLLELQLKKANETVKFQGENIQSLNNQLNSMEKEFTEKEKRSKEETFATKAQEYFDERAKIIQERENMKFDMYTEGFRRGFDMGYEKAKDQYYE
jgi:hypothetical protein